MSGLKNWAESGKDITKQARFQEQLKQCKLGIHKWSNWFSVPSGLARECIACHETEFSDSGEAQKKDVPAHKELNLEGKE